MYFCGQKSYNYNLLLNIELRNNNIINVVGQPNNEINEKWCSTSTNGTTVFGWH